MKRLLTLTLVGLAILVLGFSQNKKPQECSIVVGGFPTANNPQEAENAATAWKKAQKISVFVTEEIPYSQQIPKAGTYYYIEIRYIASSCK